MAIFHISDIMQVSSKGILCQNHDNILFIRFEDCAKNFLLEFPAGSGKCVATTDIVQGQFVFYTDPKTIIKIDRCKRCFGIFMGSKQVKEFIKLQQTIWGLGFTTFDLT